MTRSRMRGALPSGDLVR